MKIFEKKSLLALGMLILLTAMSHNTLLAQPDGEGVWRYNATLEDYDLDEVCPINLLNCWECDNSYMLVADDYCGDQNIVLPEMVNAVKNWMSYIPDQTPLNKMSIPGTHDSGAERWKFCGGPTSTALDWAIVTQSFSIAEQLKMGIRYFDIRVRENDSGTWDIHHGEFFLSLTFEQVLAQMNNFLEAHPTEGIIMSVQREYQGDNPNFISILDDYKKADIGRRLWRASSIPNMKDIRNKILLIRNSYGKDSNIDPDALNMDFENHSKVWDLAGDVVYDNETATLTAKKRLVIEHIKKAHNPAQENWIVTYLSGATHMPIGCVAARTNDVAFQYLNELPSKTNVGTILMDFPGYGLVYRIIKTNFVYDKLVDLTVAIDCHHSLLVGGASDSRINVKLYNGPQLIGEDTHVAGCSGLGDSFYQIKAVARAMPQEYTHFTVQNLNPEEGDGLGIDHIYISRTKYGIGGVDGLVEDELIENWGADGGRLWCLGKNGDDEYGSDASGTCNTAWNYFSGNGKGYRGIGAAPSKFISELTFYTQGCIPLEDQAYTVKNQANPPELVPLCGPDAPPVIIDNDTTFTSDFNLPSQGTMIINRGVALTIPWGVTLSLGSKSKFENHGTIINKGKIIVQYTATADNKSYATINSVGQYYNFGTTNNYGRIYNPVGYYGRGQGGKQTLINPVIKGSLLSSDREGGAGICQDLGGSWDSQSNTCSIDNYQVKDDYTLLVDSTAILVVNGILTNNGTIDNLGTIDNQKGTINNCNLYSGNLPSPNSVLAPCELSDDAIICGNLGGVWTLDSRTCDINNTATVEAGSPLVISPGVTYNINSTLINEGTIENSGTITNYGLIENLLEGTIKNYGTFNMDYEGSSGIGSTMSNEGEIANYGTFNNNYDFNGGISGCGTFNNICEAVYTGVNPLDGCGIFYNEAWPELSPPKAFARDISIQLDASGYVSITAEDVDSASFDACGIASLSLSKTEFFCADVGSNTVILTVTDQAGNVSTAEAVVTVEDVIPPEIISQQKLHTIRLDESGNAFISADEVYSGSTDTCDIETISLSRTEFGRCDVGTHTLILSVSDKSGNVSTADIILTVEDILPVLATVQPDCDNPTGSIEVVTVRNISDSYSIDNGSSFQESNYFEGLVAGDYDVLIKSAEGCTSKLVARLNEQPITPARPAVSVSGINSDETTLVSDSAFAYQWYNGDEIISGSGDDSLKVSEPGLYSVVVFSEDGCPSQASIPQAIGITGIENNGNTSNLQFYPNPVYDSFTLDFGESKGKKTVTIYQFNGAQTENHEVYGGKAEFPLPDYAAGVYFVKVVTENSEKTIRFIKK